MRESENRQRAMQDCKEKASKDFKMELGMIRQIVRIYSDIVESAFNREAKFSSAS
jgi:hypothetical protein